jgi:hypothetical protein
METTAVSNVSDVRDISLPIYQCKGRRCPLAAGRHRTRTSFRTLEAYPV